MSINPRGGSDAGGAVERREQSSLADVINTILDKGVVVDVFARVSLVGIELLRVDARVVIASVETYLRFAEAANRLQMGSDEPAGLPEVVGQASGQKGQGKQGGRQAMPESKQETQDGRVQHQERRS